MIYVEDSVVRQKIDQFLLEDLVGDVAPNLLDEVAGDLTTQAIFAPNYQVTGVFVAKSCGIIAGVQLGQTIYDQCAKLLFGQSYAFNQIPPQFPNQFQVQFVPVVQSGEEIQTGQIIGRVAGNVHVILAAERVLLNLLQRMSGIATATYQAKMALNDETVQILDTRKTAPGLRMFDKMAVRIGQGNNHRFGLYDMVMIKDNHIDYAGSITAAAAQVKAKNTGLRIEVEVRNREELEEAVAANVDVVMFDNMTSETVRQLVKLVPDNIKTEVSGGITLDNISEYSNIGVNYISLGFLTHTVTALDISFVQENVVLKSNQYND